jgi:DNA-binding NarL/FixJ family response regulator
VTIRIVLADDEQLVRSGLRLILESEDDLEVAAEAGDGTEAVALVRRLDPDVVLMDVQMPVMNGIEATREIAALGRETSSRVLILTTFDLDEYVYEGLRAGASGFLLKRTPAEELVDAVRVVAAGDALIDPGVTRRLIEHFREREQVRSRRELMTPEGLDELTEREREVLLLVARGLSNHEIAQKLYLSEGTVKTHVKHVFAKLALRDRAQAVILAYEGGLIEPGTTAPGA